MSEAIAASGGIEGRDPQEPHEGLGLERLIFFSDAVFAIAITLLVLDIRIPEIPDGLEVTELPRLVADVIPNILAYFISLMIIAVYWMVHHGTFAYIRRYDRRLLWLNLYLLLFVAFVPFPTGILARYGNTFFAFTFYACNQIVISLLLTLIWVHAAREHRLVDPDLDAGIMRQRFYRGLIPPLVFAVSIAFAYIVNPIWPIPSGSWAHSGGAVRRRASAHPAALRDGSITSSSTSAESAHEGGGRRFALARRLVCG